MIKKIEIPQEDNKTLNGKQKVMYAKNDEGDFSTFNYGSSVEEYATSLAVEEYKVLMAESLISIKNKISSPIVYFMYKNRMDVATLSSTVDMFQFRVKRHLKYDNFFKLNDKILKKYADALCVSIDELKDFPNE